MAQQKAQFSVNDWSIFFFLACLQLFTLGYEFGVSNHSIQIPLLYSYFDSSLYPRDWISKLPDYYPSLYFWSLGFLNSYIQDLFFLFFAGHLLAATFSLAGISRISFLLFQEKAASLITPAFFLLSIPVLADGPLFSPLHTHDSAALPFLLWALAFSLAGKLISSFVLLAIACQVHLLSALPLVGCLVLWAAFNAWNRKIWKEFFLSLFCFSILSFSSIARALSIPKSQLSPEWLEVLRLRSAHHAFPFSWSFADWGPFLLLSGFGLWGAYISWKKIKSYSHRGFLLLFVGALFSFCVIGIIFSELYPVKTILLAQPLRSSRFISLFSVIFFVGGLFLIGKDKFPTRWRKLSPRLAMGLLIPSFSLCVYQYVFVKKQVYQSPWVQLQLWALEHTQPNDLFLSPPHEKGFRIFSKRATVAEWKDGTLQFFFPQDEFANDWKKRMSELGIREKDYEEKTLEDLREIARRYGAAYLVVLKPNRFRYSKNSVSILFENQSYQILSCCDL